MTHEPQTVAVKSGGSQQYQRLLTSMFDSVATDWEQIYYRKDVFAVIHQHRREATLQLCDGLQLPAGARVLEAGCGAGLTTAALAERGYRVEAVDCAKAMLDIVRQTVGRAPGAHRVNLGLADIQRLPFADRTFDLVLAIGVLPWLDSPGPAIQEVARVVKPGGHVIANVDNPLRLNLLLDPLGRLGMIGGRVLRAAGLRKPIAHARFQSRRKFDTCLSRAGLRKVVARNLGFGPFAVLHRQVFSDRTGVRLHCMLQRLADESVPALGLFAAQYLVLAAKDGGAAA